MTNPAPIRIGILGATFETPNLGVGALAAGAIRCLRSSYPQAQLFFLDYAHQPSTRTVFEQGEPIQIPLVNMRFSWRAWLPNNIAVLLFAALIYRLLPTSGMRRGLLSHNPWLAQIAKADRFAAVSGGDSFSDLYGFSRFFYVALPQILVLLLDKPLILLPQTYGPFHSSLARTIARQIVTHAERAFCRDRHSLHQLMGTAAHRNTSRKHLSFCYDMAFGIESVAPRSTSVIGLTLPPNRDPALVGLNISGLLYRGDSAHSSSFGLRSNYHDLVPAMIDLLISSCDTSVLLVPHVLGAEEGSESDVLACEQVFSSLHHKYPGRLGILCGTYGPNEVRYVIGLCGFFVGSRMHACIAALSQNIPAVAVAYSGKFLGVLETLGITALAADARSLRQDEILSIIHNAFEARRSIARELRIAMPTVRATVHHLLDSPTEVVEVRADRVQSNSTPIAAR